MWYKISGGTLYTKFAYLELKKVYFKEKLLKYVFKSTVDIFGCKPASMCLILQVYNMFVLRSLHLSPFCMLM